MSTSGNDSDVMETSPSSAQNKMNTTPKSRASSRQSALHSQSSGTSSSGGKGDDRDGKGRGKEPRKRTSRKDTSSADPLHQNETKKAKHNDITVLATSAPNESEVTSGPLIAFDQKQPGLVIGASIQTVIFHDAIKKIQETADKTFNEITNIITLQNAQPAWISSCHNIVSSVNLLQSTNADLRNSIQINSENCKKLLEHLQNCDLFQNRHEQVMKEMKKMEKMQEKQKEEMDKMGLVINKIEQHTHQNAMTTAPSAFDQSAGKPPKAEKFCIFCQSGTHKSEICKKFPFAVDKIVKAGQEQYCIRCVNKINEKDEIGNHKDCPMKSIICCLCLGHGASTGRANHHPLFCSYADQGHPSGDHKQKHKPKDCKGKDHTRYSDQMEKH